MNEAPSSQPEGSDSGERIRQLEHQLQTAGRNNRRMADLLEVTRNEMQELKKALEPNHEEPAGS